MSIHPASHSRRHAPSELHLGRDWRSDAIRELIDQKTSAGRKPAFLFLGKREAQLLRDHLGASFGPEAVHSLKSLYYMGLEVIEIDTPTFLRTAGMKRVQGFRADQGRSPRWRDVSKPGFWTLSL